MAARRWTEADFTRCSGSKGFARRMLAASPFPDLEAAVQVARNIWFNEVDVNGWLESFAAHPDIGSKSTSISPWSKEEQSAALATATDAALQEMVEWNFKYREKFGFVFLICASGRGTPEILAELKKRYMNRPIIELEIAAQEEMKIIELRLAKLFDTEARPSPSAASQLPVRHSTGPGDRLGIIGAHLTAVVAEPSANKTPKFSGNIQRTRPPITTHVLDVSRGCPASGMEVHLEMWKGSQPHPTLGNGDSNQWVLQGSSVTDIDGRSGALMDIVDDITPGVYRITFNTGKYDPAGFYPYVSIVFKIRESQKSEHFHVPLLLSPFSIGTYRGS